MIKHLLCQHPLFALLTTRQLDQWISLGRELTFSVGETIFQEGTKGAWVFLIIAGKVRIIKQSKDDSFITAGIAGAKEIIGDYALLKPYFNTATCRAVEATKVFQLPLNYIHDFLKSHGSINVNLKNWLRLQMLKNHLCNKNFLGFMSAPSSLKYLDKLQADSYNPKSTIQTQGFAENRWFYIEEGNVELQQFDEPVQILGPGDSFGERALAGWKTIPTTIALTNTKCQILSRSEFDPKLETKKEMTFQSIPGENFRPKSYYWIGQQGEADCGLASIAMVAHYYKNEIPSKELLASARFGEKGLSLLELKNLAAFFGFKGQSIQINPNHLNAIIFPAIAHFENGHYVVIFEYNNGELVVGDPATGIINVNEVEFKKYWSERLLLLSLNS